jgi:hypothetical protein
MYALCVQILFVRSFTDRQKLTLLTASTAVLYTPENEHFGIVPIEGMETTAALPVRSVPPVRHDC